MALALAFIVGRPIARAVAQDVPVDEGPDGGAQKRERPRTISVRVVDPRGGPGVAGARVDVIPLVGEEAPDAVAGLRAPAGGVTGGDGALRLEVGGAGLNLIRVTADGFVADSRVTAAGDVRIELHPSRVIRGRVRFEDGTPAGGVEVVARFRDSRLRSGALETTAADGTFALRDLVGDEFWIRVAGDGVAGTTYALPRVFGPIAPVTESVDLTVSRGERIAGRVVDAKGEGIRGVCVHRLPSDADGAGVGISHAVTSEDGAFRIGGLASGRHALHVVHGTDPSVYVPGVESGADDVRIVLDGPYEIRGVLTDRGRGVPTSGTVVAIPVADDSADPPRFVPSARVGAGGAFTLRARGGEYRLRYFEASIDPAAAPWRWLTSWAHSPWRLISGGERVRFPCGPLELQLADGVAVVGTVIDEAGKPVAGSDIRLSSPGSRDVVGVTSGSDGRFEIPCLDATQERELRALGPGPVASDPVSVRAGGAPVSVTVRVAAAFSGRLVADDGAPVAHARIWACDSGPSQPFGASRNAVGFGTSDADGRFTCAVLGGAPTHFVVGLRELGPRREQHSCAATLVRAADGSATLHLQPR